MTKILTLLCLLHASIFIGQNLHISGKVTDGLDNAMSDVTVLIYQNDSETPLKGFSTEENGSFLLDKLEAGSYKIEFSYVGFKSEDRLIDLSENKDLGKISLSESSEKLNETTVVAKAPTITKTAEKLVFNVENTSFSVGSTMDLLKKTPGVLVMGNEIKVKLNAPIIFINGKRVYLSSSEVISLLENTDAANIKSIEVITNPSAKYDADAGTVLNIITSKAISIGYKGSVNTTFEQAVYPKYNFGTSHFYKNKWLNLYASYNYKTRKEYKEDDSYIRFFQPDEVSTKSIWETDFNRTTNSENHNGHVVLDFTLDEKSTVSLTSNISVSPNVTYQNNGETLIYDSQMQLDSTRTTKSGVEYDKQNLAFSLDYNRSLNDSGSTISATANYISYDHNQDQNVGSDYFSDNGTFLRNNSFQTYSDQNSSIFTAQTDYTTTILEGDFEVGLKLSSIDTDSKLDYFDVLGSSSNFNSLLSDDFNYKEAIYAQYFNYSKSWKKWSFNAGIRGEYTDIDAISRSLGEVNSQKYYELFPTTSVSYKLNENNVLGLSYKRSIQRPRYESLNPFRYFITENNFIAGNPNLKPAIEDRITLSYDYKNKLFFSFYYQKVNKGLESLTFQDNLNSTIRDSEANTKKNQQFSFDIYYYTTLTSWWWMQFSTSSFYLSNEFYALESSQNTYINDTFGQYLQTANSFTITKDRSLTADLGGVYISNFVFGNKFFKNQLSINLSVRKEFWDRRASLTIGVDDIFNTLDDLESTAKYYNQDNNFKVDQENRLIRIGFKYNFGNARLRDNNKQIKTDEGDRLDGK